MRGGASPRTPHTRALRDARPTDSAAAARALPVYWGNRNWAPYLTDTLREMVHDGRRHIAV
ncbi:ferrochelatase, partial [Streptomyces roseolus]